jgi:hypothetical protein
MIRVKQVALIEEHLREYQYYQPNIAADEENMRVVMLQIDILQAPLRKRRQIVVDPPKNTSCDCSIY